MLTKREAWETIAAIIGGAPEMLLVYHLDGGRPIERSGLCSVITAMHAQGAIGRRTRDEMLRLVEKYTRANPYRDGSAYLARPHNWADGVRLAACLKFAEDF